MSDSIIITPQTFIASQKDGTFTAYAENLQLQRDDAIAAKTAAEADRDAKVAAANAALAAANTARAAALAAKDVAAKATSDAALAAAKATSDAALAAAAAKIADLTAKLAAQPPGTLLDTLNALQHLYFDAAVEVAQVTPAALAATMFGAAVDALGTEDAKLALARKAATVLPTRPDQVQSAVLTAFGWASLLKLTADERRQQLVDLAPTIVEKLTAMGVSDPAARDAFIVQVMGG